MGGWACFSFSEIWSVSCIICCDRGRSDATKRCWWSRKSKTTTLSKKGRWRSRLAWRRKEGGEERREKRSSLKTSSSTSTSRFIATNKRIRLAQIQCPRNPNGSPRPCTDKNFSWRQRTVERFQEYDERYSLLRNNSIRTMALHASYNHNNLVYQDYFQDTDIDRERHPAFVFPKPTTIIWWD